MCCPLSNCRANASRTPSNPGATVPSTVPELAHTELLVSLPCATEIVRHRRVRRKPTVSGVDTGGDDAPKCRSPSRMFARFRASWPNPCARRSHADRNQGSSRQILRISSVSICVHLWFNPYMRLEGKTALITGAGSGMGRVASVLFAKEGANVIATDVARDAARRHGEARRRARARQHPAARRRRDERRRCRCRGCAPASSATASSTFSTTTPASSRTPTAASSRWTKRRTSARSTST